MWCWSSGQTGGRDTAQSLQNIWLLKFTEAEHSGQLELTKNKSSFRKPASTRATSSPPNNVCFFLTGLKHIAKSKYKLVANGRQSLVIFCSSAVGYS